MKPRKEERQPSSNDGGRTMAQPIAVEETMIGSGGGNRSNDGDRVAEKQVGWGDVSDDEQSRSQAASHLSGLDNSVVSPPNTEKAELTRATRKVLNFEFSRSEGDAPRHGHLVVGLQKEHTLEETEVTSPVKPNMDFSVYDEEGYLDMDYKNKDMGPKTI